MCFDSVPGGAAPYLMRPIIHDRDEKATTILRNVHRAMREEARLSLVVGVIPPGNALSFGKLLDLTLLVIPGGKERMEGEYRKLEKSCGFSLTRIAPTQAEVCVIEGTKA